jgi:hypothetical protein
VGTVRTRQIGGDSKKGNEQMDRTDKIVAAVSAALAAGAIGGGVAIASVQEGDQNGPEVPDTTVAMAPPGR